MKTTEVENFPGFPDGIMGPELMERMLKQAENFGATILYDDAEHLDLDGPVKKVTTDDGEVHLARAVIISTGSAHRTLGLPNEAALSGRGVSYCATCDGSFFTGLEVAVVGGGDSAAEEALFLTKFAKSVHLLVRGDEMRASKVMADRVHANPRITVEYSTQVVELIGATKLTGLVLESGEAELPYEVPADGLFVAIGNDPRTALVTGQLELTDARTIAVDSRSSRTNLPGVFAAGDVIDPTYRQAITAAASGCVAAQDVEHYLANLMAPEFTEVR